MKNVYATGKVRMAMVDELGSGGSSAAVGTTGVSQKGCFVMWQMVPDKWLIELVVGGHKVIAGSDGNVAWRHTPWIGAHTAKGGVRPLRRALQVTTLTHSQNIIYLFNQKKKKTTNIIIIFLYIYSYKYYMIVVLELELEAKTSRHAHSPYHKCIFILQIQSRDLI